MKRIVLFVLMLTSYVASAATTTHYDFSVRSPSVNIFAYDGVLTSQVPSNNSSPSFQHSSSDYNAIASNNNFGSAISSNSNNTYPSVRYVIALDETPSTVSKINVVWNGLASNDNRGRTDGVKIYIWNFTANRYDLITSTTSSTEVTLSKNITSNITNYIDGTSSNRVIIYLVSQGKTSGKKTNEIITDYVKLEVTSTAIVRAIANFQFDECTYTGIGNEVIDQLGKYSARSYNGVNTSFDAQIEKALFISNAQQHIQTSIPVSNAYSVSTWIKKPTDTSGNRYFVLGAMEAGGDLLYLDRNNSFKWGVYTPDTGFIQGNYSFNSLGSDWHYVTLVYQNSKTHLYIDGSFKETINLMPTGTLKYIGTSLDNLNTSTPQGFRAPLDEFMVFSGALSAADITQIYNNQKAKKDYDGKARAKVSCSELFVNYQFDECKYSGAGNEVIDQTGNYSATSHGGVTTTASGQVNKAANLIADDHYFNTSIPLPSSYSLSTWFKKPTANDRFFSLGSTTTLDYIMFLDKGDNWRWGVVVGDNETKKGTYSFATLDSSWHHLILTYHGGNIRLYIDGSLVDTIASPPPNGTLEFIGKVYNGNAQSFRAPLDEFMLFQGELSSSAILNIYNNQKAGKNYDGSARIKTQCPELIAHFSMDEKSWNGSSGEIVDEINNFNTQAINGLSTDNTLPALTGNIGTCGYGSFDGVNDYIEISDDPKLDFQTALTITAWINPHSLPRFGLKTIVSKDENFEFHLTPSGEINWWWQTHAFSTSGAAITPGSWHHVAVTYKKGQQVIYINGVAKGTRSYTENLVLNNDPLQIGQDQGISSRFFEGFIDEVHVFKGALSAAEVNEVYLKRHACPKPTLHHFEIVHDGNGITCEAEKVVIKACTNSLCSAVSSSPMSVDFLIDGVKKSSKSFTGSTDISFFQTTPKVISLSLANSNDQQPTHALVCKNGAVNSCDMTFSNAEFKFLYGAAETDIDNQVAGNSFSDVVKLQAVKSDNGVCKPLFKGKQNVTFSQQNIEPGGTTGLNLQVGSLNIPKFPTFSGVIELNFDNEGKAPLPTLKYLDAGQIRLHASYSFPAVSLSVSGNSNDFWVRPHKLVMTAKSGSKILNAKTSTATPAHKASENFDFVVTAYNSLGTSLANITKNYKQSKKLQLKLTRTGPSVGGFEGDFTYITHDDMSIGVIRSDLSAPVFKGAKLSAFINGISRYTHAKYSEVGLINIDIQDATYGGVDGFIVPGDDLNVGRFVPDHFELSRKFKGELVNKNNHSFAYTGEMDSAALANGAISYKKDMEPEFIITAYNADTPGKVTQNYTGTFMKLAKESITVISPTTDTGRVGKDKDTNLKAKLQIIDSNFIDNNNGTVTYKFNKEDNYVYTRDTNSLIKNYIADIDLKITKIEDKDGVTAKDIDNDNNNGILTLNPAGIDIRFGRWNIENSYGPENANLPLPMAVQYWDGNKFVVNEFDELTKYDGSVEANYTKNKIGVLPALSPLLAPSVVEIFGAKPNFIKGIGQLLLSKPSGGLQGQIRVTYEKVPSWLKFNWNSVDENSDGNVYDDNPSGVATFGVYRGNDRIISWREVIN